MGFSSGAATIMRAFANCTVTARLNGVAVKDPFPGIFDETAEAFSPFLGDRTIFKPVVSVLSSDLEGIDSNHTLEISGRPAPYAYDGKPIFDGEGITVVTLAVKK